VSVMSARRIGVKKGFLLLRSQSKTVENLQIKAKGSGGGPEIDLFPFCKSFCSECGICR
jgi:hypothetical protein